MQSKIIIVAFNLYRHFKKGEKMTSKKRFKKRPCVTQNVIMAKIYKVSTL